MRFHKGRPVARDTDDLVKRIMMYKPELAKELQDLKLNWYSIKNDTKQSSADIYVYDVIGGWFGVDATQFVHELRDIDADVLNVHINSPGGSVYDSIAIYNTLVQHSAEIHVYVDSLAASGASVIAMAGDEITMMRGSQMMIHDALMYTAGNAAELRADADFLDGQSKNIARIYAARAGGDADEWRERMLAETWLFDEEAVEIGLADNVHTPKKSDDDDEESTEDEDGETEEESIEDLIDSMMNRKHSLNNRGYKFAGRRKAPEPVTNNADEFGGFAAGLIDAMLT